MAIDYVEINEHGCVLIKLFLKAGGRTDLAVGCGLPHLDVDADKQYCLLNALSLLGCSK